MVILDSGRERCSNLLGADVGNSVYGTGSTVIAVTDTELDNPSSDSERFVEVDDGYQSFQVTSKLSSAVDAGVTFNQRLLKSGDADLPLSISSIGSLLHTSGGEIVSTTTYFTRSK